MRTPAGKECTYFYGDYHRGRSREECRLLASTSPPLTWSPDLCFTCPVPDIQAANACPYMVLAPEVKRPFPFLRRQVQVRASCTKTNRLVAEPKVGCGECHLLPEIIVSEPIDPDTAA